MDLHARFVETVANDHDGRQGALITGPPGIGKRQLVLELWQRILTTGHRLRGTAFSAEELDDPAAVAGRLAQVVDMDPNVMEQAVSGNGHDLRAIIAATADNDAWKAGGVGILIKDLHRISAKGMASFPPLWNGNHRCPIFCVATAIPHECNLPEVPAHCEPLWHSRIRRQVRLAPLTQDEAAEAIAHGGAAFADPEAMTALTAAVNGHPAHVAALLDVMADYRRGRSERAPKAKITAHRLDGTEFPPDTGLRMADVPFILKSLRLKQDAMNMHLLHSMGDRAISATLSLASHMAREGRMDGMSLNEAAALLNGGGASSGKRTPDEAAIDEAIRSGVLTKDYIAGDDQWFIRFAVPTLGEYALRQFRSNLAGTWRHRDGAKVK